MLVEEAVGRVVVDHAAGARDLRARWRVLPTGSSSSSSPPPTSDRHGAGGRTRLPSGSLPMSQFAGRDELHVDRRPRADGREAGARGDAPRRTRRARRRRRAGRAGRAQPAAEVSDWIASIPRCVGATALPSPGADAASTRRRTRRGAAPRATARSSRPSTTRRRPARRRPSLRISFAASSARRAIVISPDRRPDRPIPSLSNTITRRPCAATASRKRGSHASIVPPRPMMKTTGRPSPITR